MAIEGQSHYADRTFEELQLDGEEIRDSEFFNCEFLRVNFSGAVFRNCRFINCKFDGCDLSLIELPDTSLSGLSFRDSKLVGVDWTLANWSREVLGEALDFFDSVLSHSTFIGLGLSDVQFNGCILHNVDFREADLTRSDFSGSDLRDTLFLNTNLTRANLETAQNYQIAPELNTLKKARFAFPEALALLYSMDIVLEDRSEKDEGP